MRQNLGCAVIGIALWALPAVAMAQRPNKKSEVIAPTGITFTPTSSNLTVSWSASTGALRYDLSRRQGTSAPEPLGSGSTTSITIALPAKGVAYEYQVTAVGRIATAPSAWVPYTVPLDPTAVTAILVPPPSGTSTPIWLGPAQLMATSVQPGSIQLTWAPVVNATAYRIMRAIRGYTSFQKLRDVNAAYGTMSNGWYTASDGPIDFRWTYEYQVMGLLTSSSGEVVSAPSPIASAMSTPYVQVSGLAYTVAPSVDRIGTLNVTLTWNPLYNVLAYVIFEGSGALIYEMFNPGTGHGFVYRNLAPKYTYTVCVAAMYQYRVMQTKNAPCVDVKL